MLRMLSGIEFGGAGDFGRARFKPRRVIVKAALGKNRFGKKETDVAERRSYSAASIPLRIGLSERCNPAK